MLPLKRQWSRLSQSQPASCRPPASAGVLPPQQGRVPCLRQVSLSAACPAVCGAAALAPQILHKTHTQLPLCSRRRCYQVGILCQSRAVHESFRLIMLQGKLFEQ